MRMNRNSWLGRGSVAAGAMLLLSACAGQPAQGEEAADEQTALEEQSDDVRSALEARYQEALDNDETTLNVWFNNAQEFAQRDQIGYGKLIDEFETWFPELAVNGIEDGDPIELFRAEQATGSYDIDVVIFGDTEISTLSEEGYLAEYEPANAHNLIHENFGSEKSDAYVAWSIYNGIIYNTEAVSDDQLPSEWEDLSSLDIDFATYPHDHVLTKRTFASIDYNDELTDENKEHFRAALANAHVIDDPTQLLSSLVEGEHDVIFHVASPTALQYTQQGIPLAFFDSPLTLRNNLWSGVSENAPSPHAARLFQEFLLSDGAQEVLAEETYAIPTIQGAPSNVHLPDVAWRDPLPFGELAAYADGLGPEIEAVYPSDQ